MRSQDCTKSSSIDKKKVMRRQDCTRSSFIDQKIEKSCAVKIARKVHSLTKTKSCAVKIARNVHSLTNGNKKKSCAVKVARTVSSLTNKKVMRSQDCTKRSFNECPFAVLTERNIVNLHVKQATHLNFPCTDA